MICLRWDLFFFISTIYERRRTSRLELDLVTWGKLPFLLTADYGLSRRDLRGHAFIEHRSGSKSIYGTGMSGWYQAYLLTTRLPSAYRGLRKDLWLPAKRNRTHGVEVQTAHGKPELTHGWFTPPLSKQMKPVSHSFLYLVYCRRVVSVLSLHNKSFRITRGTRISEQLNKSVSLFVFDS